MITHISKLILHDYTLLKPEKNTKIYNCPPSWMVYMRLWSFGALFRICYSQVTQHYSEVTQGYSEGTQGYSEVTQRYLGLLKVNVTWSKIKLHLLEFGSIHTISIISKKCKCLSVTIFYKNKIPQTQQWRRNMPYLNDINIKLLTCYSTLLNSYSWLLTG